MKLTERQIQILDFCEKPKLAKEIAKFLDLQVGSIYKYMNALVKSEYLNTMIDEDKKIVTKLFYTDLDLFKSISYEAISMPDKNTYNMDFIRAAHNPFNLGLQHG